MEPNKLAFVMVVAIDGAESAEAVLEHALSEASRHGRVDVHVLTVVPDRGAVDDAVARLTELGRRKLESFSGMTLPAHRLRVHARAGDPVEEIVGLVLELEPELLVMGTGASPHLGPVTRKVVGEVPCSVLTVRVPDYGSHPLRDKQCPRCVEVRAASDGERWFCDAHLGGGTATGAVLWANNQIGLGGGAMF